VAALALALIASLAAAGQGIAAEGHPVPWQLGMQTAVTPIAEQMHGFHSFLLIIITTITLLVLGLMVFVMIRYNERANPKPSRTTHNTVLEVVWTAVPVLVLIVIAIPSFRLLFAQYDYPEADLTIKATGNQWYWSYEYPDQDNLKFDSIMLEVDELKPGQPRLLTVDNEVVVPVNKTVHVLVTASDVLHNWTVPSFGVKVDAVPGRVLKTWFRATKTGTFHGQCSELCGQRHAFMPITVRVVSEAEYDAWLGQAKQKFASRKLVPDETGEPASGTRLAAVRQ
jgi:cytochrome c oxidase subunit 2